MCTCVRVRVCESVHVCVTDLSAFSIPTLLSTMECDNIDRNNKIINDVFFLPTSPSSQKADTHTRINTHHTHTHAITGYITLVSLMILKLGEPKVHRRWKSEWGPVGETRWEKPMWWQETMSTRREKGQCRCVCVCVCNGVSWSGEYKASEELLV